MGGPQPSARHTQLYCTQLYWRGGGGHREGLAEELADELFLLAREPRPNGFFREIRQRGSLKQRENTGSERRPRVRKSGSDHYRERRAAIFLKSTYRTAAEGPPSSIERLLSVLIFDASDLTPNQHGTDPCVSFLTRIEGLVSSLREFAIDSRVFYGKATETRARIFVPTSGKKDQPTQSKFNMEFQQSTTLERTPL